MARLNRKNGRMEIVKTNNPPMEDDDTSSLPCHIIEKILSRLPVKSLLRFKSVSKTWYSLISDSKFARFHIHQTKKNSDYKTLFLSWYTRPEFPFLKFTNHNFQSESLVFPLKKYRLARVLCSCDGLVVLKDDRQLRSNEICVIWNPSTRTYTNFSCPYDIEFKTYGLCYDASNDDYKFVLVISENCYALFSYKNNSWIEKTDFSFVRMSMRHPGLFVNGALHWVANENHKDLDSKGIERRRLQQLNEDCTDSGYSDNVNSPVYVSTLLSTSQLCCFDPRDDKFKKLSKPACFDINSRFKLTDLGGHLCLYRNSYDYTMVEIWRMKNYGDCNSWTMLLKIENVPVQFSTFGYVEILFLTNEGNVVLNIYSTGIVVYNPKENEFCEIHVPGEKYFSVTRNKVLSPALCWNDSLILPSKINRTKKRKQKWASEMKELE